MKQAAVVAEPVDGDECEPDERLATLLAERERLNEEHARLATVDAGVAEAERHLEEIRAASQALDRAEQETFSRWAQGGAQGPIPESLAEERRQLEQRRALVTADFASAAAARAGVQPRINEIHGRLRQIGVGIARQRASEALQDARARSKRINRLILDLRVEWAALVALHELSRERATSAVQADRRELADVYLGVIGELDAMKHPPLEWERADVVAAADYWRKFFE